MFKEIKSQVQANFRKLIQTDALFYVEVDRDKIWELYLDGFSQETRQEHNCNCCKSFLRQYSGIVAIKNNKRISIWDGINVEGFEGPVKNIVDYLSSLPITGIFLNDSKHCGTDKNNDPKNNCVWEHFYLEAPQSVVKRADNIPTLKGNAKTERQMLGRAFEELTQESCEIILELISQNSIYRGSEFKGHIEGFLKEIKKYKKVKAADRDNYLWVQSVVLPQSVKRLRNTAIGTLLIDLSEGMELDKAVRRYEAVVAPANYKRPNALVTPKMVENAKETLSELGLLESLSRRYAQETDIPVQHVIYKNSDSQIEDVFGEIAKEAKVNPKTFKKVDEVSIKDFVDKIVPSAKNVEVLVENKHLNNLFSLITAQDPDAPNLLKWNNPFSWNYTGGITDSIKERVKSAGGKVDGELRVSLSWSNYDDLDLHIIDPNRERICFRHKVSRTTGGHLDVDMNAGHGHTREPVENIIWPSSGKMPSGQYKVIVNNFCRRETRGDGFEVQIECRGEVHDYAFNKNPRNGQDQSIVTITYDKNKGITNMSVDGRSSVKSQTKWGIETNQFHKVRRIMLSPNYWNGSVGNKHYLFSIEGCVSDETPRGFFNEFLRDDLNTHRKVFEILGGKTKIELDDNQVSGLGFSETISNDFYVRVTGKFQRILKVKVK